MTLRQWRLEYKPDKQHVSRTLKALGLTVAKGVATPRIDDVGGSKSQLRRYAKWREPPEEIKEESDLFTGEELKLPQSVAASSTSLSWEGRTSCSR